MAERELWRRVRPLSFWVVAGMATWACGDDADEPGADESAAGAAARAGNSSAAGKGGQPAGGASNGGAAESGAPTKPSAGAGASGEAGAGGWPFMPPDYEWCDGAQLTGTLSELCDVQTCPSLIEPASGFSYYADLPSLCWGDQAGSVNDPGIMRRFASSCGFSVQRDTNGGTLTYHFDHDQKLVGASIRLVDHNEVPCHTESYGQECETSGPAVDLCDPSSHCTAPLSGTPALTELELKCGPLCEPFYVDGYRAQNECGGENLARIDRQEGSTSTWSFDGDGNLVGVMRRGAGFATNCDDGQLSLGVSWGSPCKKLEPGGYGSGNAICSVSHAPLPGEGGASGAGGEGNGPYSPGAISLAEAEQCAIDCEPTTLEQYCDDDNSENPSCPELVAQSYDFLSPSCPRDGAGSSSERGSWYAVSSCGGYLISNRTSGGDAEWYFDAQDQLIGGKVASLPSRLGTYCKTDAFGQQCEPVGELTDLCSPSAGCGVPFAPTAQGSDDVGYCPRRWRSDNDCGGVNVIQYGAMEHGPGDTIWSFDAQDALVGIRAFPSEQGIVACDGKVAAGTTAGAPCRSIGALVDDCN